MKLAAVGRALPPHYFDQETLIAELLAHWEKSGRKHSLRRIESLHRKVLVGGRHLALPLDGYKKIRSWGDANDAWIEAAQELGAEAVLDALEKSRIDPARVKALIFVTTTGVATPSIDARLMNRLPLPRSIKRMPLFGLGCAAGAAGVARAADYVKAYPDEAVIVLSVELCSLTLQNDDLSVANLIASGLFADGAAAAIVAGERLDAGGPSVLGSRSCFYHDTERVMGWDVSEKGLRIVLSPEVPQIVEQNLRRDVDEFLGERELTRADISSWVCHTGGPRVLDAMRESFELPAAALEASWRSLREVGNLSSASVLFVLADTMENNRPARGSLGLMLAMGPGFCSELVLLEW